MNIYPYVYRLTHKETGQFYIGYRAANRCPAEEDLGSKYFTSSTIIANIGFSNFTTEIIAIFFNKTDAHKFEQSLIFETMSDELSLNRSVSPTNPGHTEETRRKISKALTGKPKSSDHKANLSKSKTGKKLPPRTQEHCKAISDAVTGMSRPWAATQALKNAEAARGSTRSEETKQKMREAWIKRKQSKM